MERNDVKASKRARHRRLLFFTKLLDALWIPTSEDGTTRGTFAASEVIEPSSEGIVFLDSLHVEDVGELHLPLSAEDTSRLRGVCKQAPFGQGLATVVDTRVRRCWQVDASKVTFPLAPDFMSKTVQLLATKAVHALGFDGMQVEAHMYKLLMYETDGHFEVHRDTEKEKGMFATLIIQLPTKQGFEGGELVARHKGSTKTFNGCDVSSLGFCYTVFFADCEHELLRVTNGTRLCLAFNLVRHNHTVANIQGFQWKDITSRAKKAEVAFEPWWEETMKGKPEKFGEKVAIPLQHEYTKANLSFAGLKGDDSIVAEVLKSCKDKNGDRWLDHHLCLVTKYQKKEPDSDHDNDYKHYYKDVVSSDDDDDDDDDDVDASDGPGHDDVKPAQPSSTITRERDVYEEEFKWHWIGMDNGAALAFKGLNIDIDTEVAIWEGEKPFFDDPDDGGYVGNTGNEGATMEHWYHRAMLVVWPKRKSISIACGAGVIGALDILDRIMSTEMNDLHLCESVHEVVTYCENNPSKVWERMIIPGQEQDPITSWLLNLCIKAGTGSQNYVLRVLSLMSKTFHCEIYYQRQWKVGIRNIDVTKGIAAAVQMVGWVSCSSIIIELVKECALSQGESFAHLALQLFQAGNRDAAVIVAKKPCEVFNARIDELSQHRKPVFSWCQPLQAKLRFYPTVEEFLRGPQESMIYYGVQGLTDARKFASRNFNEKEISSMLRDGYSAIGKEGGYGRKAFCEIQKTRHAFEAATKHWEKEQEELKCLRLHLEKLKTIFADTNLPMSPNEVGEHERKRKTMDTEVLDLCRVNNTKKNDMKSHMENIIDLTSEED